MKIKAIRSVKHLTFLLILVIVGYSCSDDSTKDLIETQWEVVNITAKKSDWRWIEADGRYEAVFDLPELTKFIYESGAQLSYVFIGTQGVDEVQKMLPFVHTYYEEDNQGNPILYTETISGDFQLGTPSTVAFYIQASDLGRDDTILGNYNFRVVLLW